MIYLLISLDILILTILYVIRREQKLMQYKIEVLFSDKEGYAPPSEPLGLIAKVVKHKATKEQRKRDNIVSIYRKVLATGRMDSKEEKLLGTEKGLM